jgi:hypothetical protein
MYTVCLLVYTGLCTSSEKPVTLRILGPQSGIFLVYLGAIEVTKHNI